MMKLFRILMMILFGGLLAIFLDCMVACAQDPNPQTSFATTLLYANPSLYLNFNDPKTAFKDQVSGLSFTPPPPNVSYPGVPPPIPSATDIGWWPLNEARQSTAIDNSASADNGRGTAPRAAQAPTITPTPLMASWGVSTDRATISQCLTMPR